MVNSIFHFCHDISAGNQTAPAAPYSYNQVRGQNVWGVYQTEPLQTPEELAQQRRKRSVLTYYVVGADDDCADQTVLTYKCNGPLRPLTTYR